MSNSNSNLEELKVDINLSKISNTDSNTSKKIRSPQHIFDNDLYSEWDVNDNDKSDISASKVSNDNGFSISKKEAHTIDCETGIFCVKWSPNKKYLAVGCQDGGIRILNTKNGKLLYRLRTRGSLPVCSLEWRPSKDNGLTNMLVSASSYGYVNFWQIESEKSLYDIHEKDNNIYCLEYSPNNERFATAGKDRKIRIYDDNTKKVIYTMEKGYMEECPGHSNRIFCLKWKPNDNNIIVSGGWDDNVLFWDLRNGKVFRNIYGTHIAGNCIDINSNDKLLTGEWKNKNTIKIWDFNTGKLFKQIKWNPSPQLYSCKFYNNYDNIICAAGTGFNVLKFINIDTNKKSQSISLTNKKGIYCFDFDQSYKKVAFAGLCEDVCVFDVDVKLNNTQNEK